MTRRLLSHFIALFFAALLLGLLSPDEAKAQCAGFCGTQSSSGCWCDNSCIAIGDCCADACPVCNVTGCAAPPAEPCSGCSIAGETNPLFTAASGCNNGSVSLGSGAFHSFAITPNTYYVFTWNNGSGGNVNGFCATSNGSGGSFTTNQTCWFSGSSNSLTVSANRSSCTWSTSSAQLTYRHTTPTSTANTPTSSTFCSGGSVSIAGGTVSCGQGVFWQGTNPSGTGLTAGPQTVSASGTYYYRPNNNGCWGTAQGTTVTVVADPTLSGATISNGTICAGGISVVTSNFSGGTGSQIPVWQYFNGSSWVTVSNGTPGGAAYTNTGSDAMTISGITAIGAFQYRRILTNTSLSCDATSGAVTLNVVGDPAAPTATRSPVSATVCAGATLTLTNPVSGGDGAGSCTFEYEFSTNNGGSWSLTSNTAPSFAAVTGTNIIRIRRNCNGTGCDISPWQTYSWTVVADPVLSGATITNSTICVGGSSAITSNLSGGTGTQNPVWQYFNGSTWVSVSNGTPVGAVYASTGTGTMTVSGISNPGAYQFRRDLVATADGCDATSGAVTLTVVAGPAVPTATKSPDVTELCAGATLTLTSPVAGSGGTGTCSFEYQSSTDNGANWSAIVGTAPSFSAVVGTNLIRLRRNCDGSGCGASAWQNYSWNVVADPVAPTATKSPSVTNVCVGTVLNLTGVTDNGGGTGSCVIQYSVNNGAWSNSLSPVATPTSGSYTIAIRKNCSGIACDISSASTYIWNVVDDPVAPTMTRTPNSSPVCAGTVLSINVVSQGGGTGTCNDEYRYSENNGGTWSAWSTTIPSITSIAPGGVAATTIIESRRNCNGDGCNSNTNSVNWTVNPVPVVVATPSSQTFCSGATTAINLSTVPAVVGTTFSWTVTGETGTSGFSAGSGSSIAQVLTNTGAAPANVTYTVTPTAAGCIGNPITVVITVNPVANVVATPPSLAVCNGGLATVAFSSTVTAAAYTWTVSGTPGTGGFAPGSGNSISQVLTNSTLSPGTVTYVVTPSAHGCTGTPVNVPVTVNPTPAVSFSSIGGPYCISQTTPISLVPFATPTGGVFSGTGVAGNDFVPSLAAVGTNTLTYTYTDANNCVNTATTTVQVTGLPLVSFSGLSTTGYCVNNTAPTALTGFPTGGTFTGSGMSGSNFTPSVAGVGLHAITYTYTDGNGCVNFQTQSVNVFPLPTIGIFDFEPSYCIDDAPITITGFPPGGTFSGTATTQGGVFSPGTAGVGGPYTITYEYTDDNGCTNTTTANTVVNPLPVVSFSGLAADYCVDAASATLVGSPAGGTFSGPGITSGGVFTPSVAGVGIKTITYTYTDGNGCTNSQSQDVEIIGTPGVSFTGLDSEYCIDEAAVTLTGNQAPNGTFSGPGVTDNGNGTATFNPAAAAVGGPYNITYSFTNPNGCGFAETQQVVVNPLPTMSFTGLGAAYCVDAAPITLTGVHAPGGTFTGSGITDNANGTATFNPTTAGSGPHSITYTFTDANGCTNSNSQNVTVNPTPVVSYIGFGSVCVDQPAQPLTGTPVGGVFSGTGVSGNAFFPTIAGVGQFAVTYTYTDGNGCDDFATHDFNVHNIPVVTVNPSSVQVCPGDAVTFLVSATGTNLSYQWQVNTGSGFVNLNNGGAYSGVTTTALNVGPISQGMNGFQYRAVVSGSTCATQVFSTPATINISNSPVIDVQPTDQFVCVGDNALFSTTASGTGLTYQWQINTGSGWSNVVNGGAYSGATTSTLTVSNYSAGMDGDLFRVVVSGSSNCTSSATSEVASLNGSTSPAILSQPADQSICDGGAATFEVSAGGSGLAYQWQVNDGNGWTNVSNGGIYSGATTASLTVSGATAAVNGYVFRVEISSASCPSSSVSAEVTLTITDAPVIAQQPIDVQVCPGDNATFSVLANGAGNTYQWQINTGSGFSNIVNGGPYSGASTTNLNVSGVTSAMDGHQFRVIVQNPFCTSATTSIVATLSESVTPIIATQPADGYYCAGDNVTFTAAASGSGLTYQWQLNTGSGWVNVANNATFSGATTASLTVAATTTVMNGHLFRLVVAGSVNCTGTALTAVVSLIETNTPVILTQPIDQGVCENSGASFTVSAAGSVTYQWQVNTGSGWNNVANGGIYSGATTANLALSAVSLADDGNQYRVIVSGVNCTGDATSQVGTLTITDEPTIWAQSPDQYVCTGDDAVFAVSVAGTGINYQWQENSGSGFVDIVDGGSYAGSNTAVLTILGATPAFNGYAYQVIVSSANCQSAATSAIAYLYENAGPVVLTDPNNAQGCPGDNAVFTVLVGGTGLTYQWQVNTGSGFVNLNDNSTYSGTTTSSLLVQGMTNAMNNYQYRVVAAGSINCAVTATSAYGVLTVSPNPTITLHPSDLSYCDGDIATLTATANGAQGYQWQENSGSGWVNLTNGGIYAGVNTSILTLAGVTVANDGFQYRVIVSGSSNCLGTSTSNAATITEDPNPFIAQQPTDQFVCPGDAATFAVAATGSGLVYQWQENSGSGFVNINDGGVYSGATTATLIVSDGTGLDGNQYQVIITGTICTGSSTTVPVTLNETTSPAILTQPTDAYACANDNVTFAVTAGGSGLDYQWQVNNGSGFVNVTDGVLYSGSNTASLVINGVNPGMDGNTYQVIISGEFCPSTSTSAIATLFINTAPVITAQPQNDAVCSGQPASFNFNAVGPNLTYQWQVNDGTGWTNVANNLTYSGATTPTLNIAIATFGMNGYQYRAIVTGSVNCAQTVTTSVVTLSVTQQPIANAGTGGTSCNFDFTFSAVASAGVGTWTQISGPGTSTYNNPNSPTATATATLEGQYEYQWEEVNGICSDVATVTVDFYNQPVANAGNGGNECDLDFNLVATASFGNGTWTQTSGPGTSVFTTPNIPNTDVTVSVYGTYVFRWTEVNGTCSDYDEVTVNFYLQPVANAGSGGDECDQTFTFSAQQSVGTGVWTYTGPGTAIFNLSTSPVATVTAMQYGTYQFTWTETNGTCVSSDVVTVNFYQQPVAEAGIGGNECDLDFILNATLTTGTGVWSQTSGPGTSAFSNPSSPSAMVTVSQVGTYIFTWTETNGVCVSTDAVTVNFYNQTVADAGTGGNECDLDFLLNAQPSFGIGTWTQTAGPGFANFIPNANAPNATAQVSQYGTYSFTWTEVDGVCTSNDAVSVNFYPQPVANAGPDANECDLDHVFAAIPSAGIGTWTQVSGPGTTTFVDPNSATTTGAATVYGTYVYQWEEVSGTCTSSDLVAVNYYLQPVADAGPDASQCDLDQVLAAVLTSGNGTWSQSSGPGSAVFTDVTDPNSLVTVTAYGAYTFTWVEVNGTCSSTDAVVVNFYQQPVANAGTGGDECDLNFLFSAQPSFGTGAWTYTGPGIATFNNSTSPVSTVSVNTYGTYVFTWTETNGTCVDSEAVTVNFYEQPVANAGSGGDECDLDFTLGATLTTGTGIWAQTSGTGVSNFSNAADPNAVVTVTQVGTYVYTWTETNGVCVSTDVVTVSYYNQPIADAGNGGDECDLDFVLNAQPSFGLGTWTQVSGPGFSNFVPNANVPGATVQVSQYGTYQYRWREVEGVCSSEDFITVNYYPQPVANPGPDADECDLDHVLAAVPSAGVGTWTQVFGLGTSTFSNPNSPTAVVTVSQYGTYGFRWTEVSGTCTDAADVVLNFYQQPVAEAGFGGFECDLDFPLAATPSVGVGTWTLASGPGTATFANANSPTSLVTVSALGVYTYTWTEVNGTCVSSDNVTVTYEQQTTANAGNGGDECDLNFTFNAVPSFGIGVWTYSGPGTAFFTNANSATATVTVSTYGSYTFTWTETFGTCITSDAVTVNFYQQPVASAGQGGSECDLDFQFNATLSSGQGTWSQTSGPGTSIFSNASAANALVTVSQVGTYTFTWTEFNGVCFDDQTITVNFYAQPVADAGQGGSVCDLEFDFNGSISTIGGNGVWTLTNGFGTVTFLDASDPITHVDVSAYGPYQFTWTETNGTCTDAVSVLVNFYEQPTANAGQGGDACFLDFQLVATPSVGVGQWTMTQGPGTAVFDNASSPFSLVTVSTSGTYEFTWTETTGGVCTDFSSVSVNFFDQPVANAGQGGNECDLDFNLAALPNLGSGEWTQTTGPGTSTFISATSANTAVTVSTYGTYTYTWTETNGICVSSDVITVNYYDQPVANAGQGGSECDLDFGLAAVPSVGIGTWTQASGPGFSGFAPSANAPNALVTVNQYGTYTYTWTEVNGTCSNAQTITVNYYQQPVANIGAVSDQCDLDITLAAVPSVGLGTWSVTGPGNGVFSSVSAPNATLTVSSYGTYVLTWSEMNGTCTSAATASVTFNSLPAVSYTGLAATYCIDQTSVVALTGTPAGGTFSGTGVSGNGFIPSVAGVGTFDITYTYTDANGCSNSQTQSVDVNPLPVVSFTGLGAAYCVSETASVILTGSPAGGTFSGAGVSGSSFVAATAGAGTHVITYSYTDGLGCTNTTQQSVVVNALPVVAYTGLAAEYCEDVSLVTLSGTPVGGAFSGPGITSNIFNPTVAGTGIHTVIYTFTDGNGCTNTASQSVNVNTLPQPVISPSGPIQICQGSFVVLNAGAGYFQYSWNNSENGQTQLVTQAGTYNVTVTSQAGCQALSADVQVIVNPVPVVNIGVDTTICTGTSITLNAGNAGSSYLWSTLATTQQIVVSDAGSYEVTVTDGNGCSATDVISLSVSSLLSPVITANGPTTFCQGQTVTLNAGTGFGTYLWSTGAQSQLINVTEGGTYDVAVSDPFGCSGTASIVLTANQLPNAVIIPNGTTTLCPGSSVTLAASNTFGNYNWNPGGATTAAITVSTAGSYTVTVTDPLNGCSATSVPVVVTQVQMVQPSIVANGPLEFCAGGSVVLSVVPSGAFTSFLWTSGSNTPSVTVTSSTEISVSVLDANNCLNNSLLANPLTITVWNPQPVVEQSQGVLSVVNGPFACYQWFRNGNPIPGATGSSFTPQFSGNHYVRVCDENDCFANSSNIEFTVGIADVRDLYELKVYPSPNAGHFTVEADLGSHTDVTLVVKDVLGQNLMREERIEGVSSFRRTFDISHLANGMYYVQVIGNGGMTVRPVVKQ